MEDIKEYSKLIMMEPVALKGNYETKMVWINDKELTPEFSIEIYNHSADGFDWGYSGAGSAQLALAILLELTKNKKLSMILHHVFKNEYISTLSRSDFSVKIDIGEWFYKNIIRSYVLSEEK